MKRTYIKPEMELLDSELQVILCVSGTTHGIDGEDITPNTPSNPPDGPTAREFDGDFDFDE
ncbi:MAG: hypothetical protein IJV38_14075 [Prevotella sp.]|nr:hypothetical protein [Prevotella sp.]MBQ9657124.1 hypothetical protein [Prevotella sp.]